MRTPLPPDDDARRMGFVQITPKTARILFKILELESEGVTIGLLAEKLRMQRSEVYEFIKQAEKDSRRFLDCNDWSSTKGKEVGGGRHTDILELRPDRLVTNPLSAKILLMLAKISKESREVNREAFMASLLRELNYLESDYPDLAQELTARIKFLIQLGDICSADDTVPDIIWISWLRYHSQKAYLELLVKEKLPKQPKT